MTRLAAALVLAPIVGAITIGIWLRQRWLAREAARMNAALEAKGKVLEERRKGQGADESIRKASERRRAAADDKRRQANQIESGQPVEDRIRLVR